MGAKSSIPRLEITLFGPLQVRLSGQPVAFRTDAERALLAILAAAQGIPQRRDTLAALLSPDRPDVEALTYLRNRLARLREALADREPLSPWFAVDRKQIALRSGTAVLVDLAQFAQHLAAVEGHAHRELAGCPTCLDQLRSAVGLIHGELLAGLNFASEPWQTWVAAQREHYQLQALAAMTLLRDALLVRGEWVAMLAIAQRQLQLEPWLESAHRASMLAHQQLGDRSAAVAQFEQCARVLQAEFGTAPEAATQQLRQQILEQRPFSTGKTLRPNNLPLSIGRFFGREVEQAQLLQRLVDPNQRLISIVGAGGMGKTRLALEVARQLVHSFPDGVWLVPLDASHHTAEQIEQAIGEALELMPEGRPLTGDQVLALLRDKRILLILDNCELALDALAFAPTWLRRAPHLAILATSREPLRFAAEAVLLLHSLSIGDAEPGVAEALFAERAAAAHNAFALSEANLAEVRAICALVDGAPLGIKLAAAWARRRSLGQIRDAISHSLDFLSTHLRDADPRHHSMRAVFETSWQLLDPQEQAALAALAVFPATFTVAAAAAVAGAELHHLDALCEKSLLQQLHTSERYHLHSLLRQFAADKLGMRAARLDQAFVAYFAQFARLHAADYSALQPEWRNLSAAVAKGHALAAWPRVLELLELLDEPWFRQIRFGELREALILAVDAAAAMRNPLALARILLRLGELELEQNAYTASETHLAAALQQLTRLENGQGIAQCHYLLARLRMEQADDAQALALSEAARHIFEQEQDWLGVARTLNLSALCHMKQHTDHAQARISLERSVALQRALPPSATFVEALRYLARLKSRDRELASAEQDLSEATAISRDLHDLGEHAAVLFDRVVLYRRQGRLEAALACGVEALKQFKTFGSLRWEGLVQTQLAIVHQARHEYDQALVLFTSALQIFEELGDRYEQAYGQFYLFRLHAVGGNTAQSLHAREQALQLNVQLQDPQLAEWLA
jgi:predicted ATPase/DNA-binding SARP family transcriptional activator